MTTIVLLLVIAALAGWVEYRHRGLLDKLQMLSGIPASTAPLRVSSPLSEDLFKQAFADSGLNIAHVGPDFDVLATGKLGEVLHYAAKRAGKTVRTVQDLQDLLDK